MGFLRLFKPPKHQQFNYKPRYWDPRQEEAEERRKRIEQLEQGGVEAIKTRISGGFRKGAGGAAAGSYRSARVRRSNRTLLLVMIGILILTYIGYVYYFPDLDAWLNSSPARLPPLE